MDTLQKREKRGGTTKAILGTALGSFVLGGGIVGYLFWQSYNDPSESEGDGDVATAVIAPESGDAEVPEAEVSGEPNPEASAAAQNAEAMERVEETQGGIDQRLAAAEQRLARLDLQAEAAAGNAARAEGLLISFATRRALERGAELGFLADQLRLRFGDALPNAVRIVIAASREPITLDQLIGRLEGLGPKLSDASDEPTLERIQREIGDLFIVRRESSPSPQPQRRLERARLFLESGRIDAAIAEVRNLPGADKAEKWLADAERYAEAQHALDLIETSAVLEPRRLRDGTGQRIDQPSPASETAQ